MNMRQVDLYGKTATVCVHPVGDYVFDGCARKNWKPNMFRAFGRLLSPGMRFWDIGAYAGATTLYPWLLGCQVAAFECDPVAVPVLMRNVAETCKGGLPCAVYPWAIGEATDLAGGVAFGARGAFGASVASPAWCGRGGAETRVPVMSLADAIEYVGHAPEFVKINVQGYESRLLAANMDTLEALGWPTLHVYVRPASCADKAADMARLAQALGRYPAITTELGDPVDPAELATPLWSDVSDFSLLAMGGKP